MMIQKIVKVKDKRDLHNENGKSYDRKLNVSENP
jgi:hypothetical protein